MRIRAARLAAATAGAVAVATILATGAQSVASVPSYLSPPTRNAGQVVSSSQAARYGALTAVSVVPRSSTVWAVGYRGHGSTLPAYAMRRRSGHWHTVSVESAPKVYLQAIAAGSATSIWAVGDLSGATLDRPAIEHSTGGRFHLMHQSIGFGSLLGVAASSASNAWIVGASSGNAPLVARWTGTKWRMVGIGNAAGLVLSAVSTSSPANVWLLGRQNNRTYAASWNGHAFVPNAPSLPSRAVATSITTTSPDNTWVSAYLKGSAGSAATLVSHWNGSSWTTVTLRSVGVRNIPTSIAAAGHRVYLAGYDGPKNSAHAAPFVFALRGQHWRRQHVAALGKNAELVSIGVSTKLSVAVGAWYAGAAAGSHQLPPHQLAVVRRGQSWTPTHLPS